MNTNIRIQSAVAIIVFNRPDLTRILLDKLALVRISKLYIIIDGPRINNNNDRVAAEKISEMLDHITFADEILYNKSASNMGCKERVISGLSWLFDNEEHAIILEDDCIPSISFLQFCDQLLEKYKSDTRVGIISGTNFSSDQSPACSYSFSKYANIWGWATWRRTWLNYDKDLSIWGDLQFRKSFYNRCASNNEYRYWNAVFTQTKLGLINTWDYQLWLSLWAQNQLSIVPNINLINNLGFAHPNATHTGGQHPADHIKAGEITFPLSIPTHYLPNPIIDATARNLLYRYPSFMTRAWNKFKRTAFSYFK